MILNKGGKAKEKVIVEQKQIYKDIKMNTVHNAHVLDKRNL